MARRVTSAAVRLAAIAAIAVATFAAGASEGLSLDQAIATVEQKYRARVVRAEVSESQGRKIYVLRLLNSEGRVWTIRVDAASGEELN
ncbi:MAG: PepSY domain-containing protein [Steroidobacteraceae bacterium]|nr:PepSY domain-containing protein [Steroidobacteraceae bacterium]MDW8260697.1 PepSY domain-containing protein [Gammaproteobacteria bacterium]